jgi:GT2 family glycosyltransferase
MSFLFTSVVIPNFNGARYLPGCLDALLHQSYPLNCYEIIVVDNGSEDGSVQLLQERYPEVQLIVKKENSGFTGACNIAIQRARGDYVVLLNNDTAVTFGWLESMVAVANANADAGMVTGHLQLFYDQLELTIESHLLTSSDDAQFYSLLVSGVDTGVSRGHIQYLQGFKRWESLSSGERYRQADHKALIGVPLPLGESSWQLCLKLCVAGDVDQPVDIKISSGAVLLAQMQLQNSQPMEYKLTMPEMTRDLAMPVIQNAGTLIFKGGYGRDRGVYVRNSEALYETDHGQYSSVEEVFAGCGASLLIRRAMLEDVGLLDSDFFAYYEDMDLSWRARLRNWKVLYAPNAVVRHIHCGTSEEWSPRFMYLIERNRLAMVFKNGSLQQLKEAWLSFISDMCRSIASVVTMILYRRSGWRPHLRRLMVQVHICSTLLLWIPRLIYKRYEIQSARKAAESGISAWFAHIEE